MFVCVCGTAFEGLTQIKGLKLISVSIFLEPVELFRIPEPAGEM